MADPQVKEIYGEQTPIGETNYNLGVTGYNNEASYGCAHGEVDATDGNRWHLHSFFDGDYFADSVECEARGGGTYHPNATLTNVRYRLNLPGDVDGTAHEPDQSDLDQESNISQSLDVDYGIVLSYGPLFLTITPESGGDWVDFDNYSKAEWSLTPDQSWPESQEDSPGAGLDITTLYDPGNSFDVDVSGEGTFEYYCGGYYTGLSTGVINYTLYGIDVV